MKRTFRLTLAAISIGALVGCGESTITGPGRVEAVASSDSAANLLWFGSTLISCPTTQTQSTTAVLGPLGGLLSVAGTTVSIPAGALLSPVTMTLTVPASRYMEIDVSVEGSDHFLFELPVVVSLNYSRCTSLRARLLPVEAWYIDSETKELLELMPGIDNKLTRTITFTTPHLSGYAIAN